MSGMASPHASNPFGSLPTSAEPRAFIALIGGAAAACPLAARSTVAGLPARPDQSSLLVPSHSENSMTVPSGSRMYEDAFLAVFFLEHLDSFGGKEGLGPFIFLRVDL